MVWMRLYMSLLSSFLRNHSFSSVSWVGRINPLFRSERKTGLWKDCLCFVPQMPINVSRWRSRWWRWTEMRWPGSSGSSSKKRCLNAKRVSEREWGGGKQCLSSLFLKRWHTHRERETECRRERCRGQRKERNRRVRSLDRHRQNENWVRQE